jgi:hypothetical protein
MVMRWQVILRVFFHETNWADFERAYLNGDKANVPYNVDITF